MYRALIWMVVFTSLTFSAFSQTQNLTGKVLNEKNEPLQGVSVKVQQGPGTSTDIEGRYTLALEVGKKYTMLVTLVGYAAKTITDIDVSEGAVNELDIVLQIEAKNLDAVVVRSTTRRQENTASLLNFQKNSPALSSGLAADFIRRTPDKNTGEILKRVSGASIQDNKFVVIRGLSDRYNAAMINNALLPSTEPDKKVFSFDIFPSSMVDNIVINKTATPDLTGEFAGGLVQVNTKDIPAKNELSIGISLGFNTQSVFKDFTSNKRNKLDWLGFDDGTRNLPGGFPKTAQAYRSLGSSAEGLEQQYVLSRGFNNDVYAQTNFKALPTQAYNITWGNTKQFEKGGKFGSVISLIYRRSQLKYQVERAINEQDGLLENYFDDLNIYTVNTGALANFTYVKGRHKISFKNLFNQLFEDNYYIRTGFSLDRQQEVDFRSSFLNQRSLYSGQLEGEHQLTKRGIKLNWNGNASVNWKKQPDLRTSAFFRRIGSTTPFEVNDDDSRRFYSDLQDYSYGVNGSLEFPFTLGGEKQSFKTGGSTLIRIRDFKSRVFRYVPASNQFDQSKGSLAYDQIYAAENIGPNGFVIDEFTNNQDKYFGVSIVNGMYGMFDNKLGEKVRLIWGVRAENFQQFLTTKDNTAKRVNVQTEEWDFLPSVNLTLSPNLKQNIRISASRTVSRPEFREIAPFPFYDYQQNYGVVGNPQLQMGGILNGDIRYEIYPKGGEGITLGFFYKQFNDPIELRIDGQSVPTRRIYSYQNADEAFTIGGELEIRKNLAFFGTAMEAFDFFGNLTVSQSKVKLGGSNSIERPLQGQSPYLVNAGLQYNNKSWNGSLLYNRIGQRLSLVGAYEIGVGGIPDVYERSRNLVDLQIAKKILNDKGEIKLTWSDVLGESFYFYENVDSKKSYNKGTDRLFNAYKPGSTISLGFNYNFSLK